MRDGLNQIFFEVGQLPSIVVKTNMGFEIQIFVGASD